MSLSLTAPTPHYVNTKPIQPSLHASRCQFFEVAKDLRFAGCRSIPPSTLFDQHSWNKVVARWAETFIKRRLHKVRRGIAKQLATKNNEDLIPRLNQRSAFVSIEGFLVLSAGQRPRAFGESIRATHAEPGSMAPIADKRSEYRRGDRQGETRRTPEEEYVLRKGRAEVDRFMAHFIPWFEKKLAIISYTIETAAARDEAPADGGESSTGAQSGRNSGKGHEKCSGRIKRQYSDEDQDDTPGGGDDNGQDRGGAKRARRGESEAGKWACPYHKHDPNRHKKGVCRGAWPSIHRLKEHLYRKHLLPKFRCARCTLPFANNEALEAHQRADEPCKKSNLIPQEGIDVGMEEKLKRRKKQGSAVTDEERWKEIYLILFPNTDRKAIPSPYAIHSQTPTMSTEQWKRKEAKIKRVVPQLVRQQIENRFEKVGNEILQDISDITRGALSEFFRNELIGDESPPLTPRTASRATTPGPAATEVPVDNQANSFDDNFEFDFSQFLNDDFSFGHDSGFDDDKASASDSGYASTSTGAGFRW
ncbi:hypothetical protein F5Y16DRAFT_396248 [Xylariaceae sp. FL0255]|nr:hypothetical protein F5Y16DRAFT_396248 [Xylariaceae sp. FL0255]